MTTRPLAVTRLSTFQELLPLREAYEQLLGASSAPSPFLTLEWIESWLRHFGDRFDPLILLAHEPDGTLVGIAPLARSRRRLRDGAFLRELVFLGGPVVAGDHLDFLLKPGCEEPASRAFSQWLKEQRRLWDLVNMSGLAQPGWAASHLQAIGHPWSVHAHPLPCPCIDLPGSWETYRGSLGKNMRYNLKRYPRRLERDHPGEVARSRVTDPAEVEGGLQTLFRLHQQVKNAQGLPGAFADEARRGFHRQFARAALERGWLRLYRLRVGEQEIAAIYCIHFQGTVHFYQTGYDLAWKSEGPGLQIMAHAIQEAIAEGAKRFDFLRGDEPYKQQWAQTTRFDQALRVPGGFGGLLAVSAYRGGRRLRDAWRAKVKPSTPIPVRKG